MNDGRWKRISSLFHVALELAPQARGEFLARACGGDEDLRREIELLLSAGEEDSAHYQNLLGRIAAELVTVEKDEEGEKERATAREGRMAGRRLGNYQILSFLNAGGMGEIYHARHIRLDLDVAIKILPEHLSADQDALKRFEREARALAALSHPNIVSIHDFGSEEGTSYAVMELLEKSRAACAEPGFMINQPQADSLRCDLQTRIVPLLFDRRGVLHSASARSRAASI